MLKEFRGLVTILDHLKEKPESTLSSLDAILRPPLEGCSDCCEELSESLKPLDNPKPRDWLKLKFKYKAIEDIKTRLASYKGQLSLALQIIEL